MSEQPQYIDGVNWVTKTIPTGGGPVTLSGLSVRSIRKALEGVDDDALVIYMFEITPEIKQQVADGVPLMIGPIAMLAPSADVVALCGPEGVRGLKNAGRIP
jgi:hypothetical protein